jgi:ADP-ribose pyrophosphatase
MGIMESKAELQRKREEGVTKQSRIAYEGHRMDLSVETFELDGRKKVTEMIHLPGAVVIVAMDDQKRILLIQQWRRSLKRIIFELPAGTLDEGEDPIVCAQRELQEETGFRAESLDAMGGFYPAPSYSDDYLHLFFAKDLEKKPLPQDDDEGIDLVPMSIESALELIENGTIIDAKSIIGILRCAKYFTY